MATVGGRTVLARRRAKGRKRLSACPAMVAVGRLKRRPDFLRVAAGRRRWVAPGLILQALGRSADGSTADDGPARVGFTASAKVGGAVVRNRARRRLR